MPWGAGIRFQQQMTNFVRDDARGHASGIDGSHFRNFGNTIGKLPRA
jgi:hypothetical protein